MDESVVGFDFPCSGDGRIPHHPNVFRLHALSCVLMLCDVIRCIVCMYVCCFAAQLELANCYTNLNQFEKAELLLLNTLILDEQKADKRHISQSK